MLFGVLCDLLTYTFCVCFLFFCSIHNDGKGGKKKTPKKGARKAADNRSVSTDGSGEEQKKKNSAKKSSLAKKAAGGDPAAAVAHAVPMAGFRPDAYAAVASGLGGLPPAGLAIAPGMMGGPPTGYGAGIANVQTLDMMTYQNILRQRELAALREQHALGLPPTMDPLLRGGPTLLASPPAALAGVGYGGLESSGLTPEEQLYLLRRNQDEMSLSVRQRMQQQQQQARQMQHLSLMELQQAPTGPPDMGLMMQERQRLLERQRLEQLLATHSFAGMGGPPPY